MAELKLTRDTGLLTLEQRRFYETSGYLVIPRLVSHQLINKCSKRFDDIVSGKVDRNIMMVVRDVTDRKAINKIQELTCDPIFCQYFEYKPILDIVEAFTGPNIMATHTMVIAKPPDAGSKSTRHPPHQDLYYFPFRPENKIVAAWTAIEPCDTENGCLFVAPGSHLEGKLYPHSDPTDQAAIKLYHGIQELPYIPRWLDLEMEPGDTVFFHPMLIHGSGVNKSNRTRKAISCHYAAAECTYIEIKGTLQENIGKEGARLMERLVPGADVSYQDVWRLKSKCVRGIRSNL